jgi:hypothetical protein
VDLTFRRPKCATASRSGRTKQVSAFSDIRPPMPPQCPLHSPPLRQLAQDARRPGSELEPCELLHWPLATRLHVAAYQTIPHLHLLPTDCCMPFLGEFRSATCLASVTWKTTNELSSVTTFSSLSSPSSPSSLSTSAAESSPTFSSEGSRDAFSQEIE